MGICHSKANQIPEEEIVLASHRQVRLSIDSYTKGLKSRLKEVMIQSKVGGIIRKCIYAKVDDMHSTPIHTEIIIYGTDFSISDFLDLVKGVFEESVDYKVSPFPIPELDPKTRKFALIEKTDNRIFNRKASDAGDDGVSEADLIENTLILANQLKNKAKQVMDAVSAIPILSQYTSDLREEWSLLVKEMPKVFVTARSLFHPFSVYTFSMYEEDELCMLMACIEWKHKIPFDSIELFTTSGVILNDVCTLFKEKDCLFADAAITKEFFEKEQVLKREMQEITKEPFVYHKIALNGMTLNYMIEMLGGLEDNAAQETIKEDLCVSSVISVQIYNMIKKNKEGLNAVE